MDVASIFHFSYAIPMDVPFLMQSNCIILDPIVKENIEIHKKRRTYELNRH
jgi:hypothetical protein